MKKSKLTSQQLAGETLHQLMRVLTNDAFLKPESIQTLVDLVRESIKVTRTVAAAGVFLVKTQKQLALQLQVESENDGVEFRCQDWYYRNCPKQ
jgi:hypothetical protein